MPSPLVDGGIAERVERLLRERCPEGTAPRGTFTDIAREVGRSRENVRLVASRLGIKSIPKPPERRQCPVCGSVFPWTNKQRLTFERRHGDHEVEPTCSVECANRAVA